MAKLSLTVAPRTTVNARLEQRLTRYKEQHRIMTEAEAIKKSLAPKILDGFEGKKYESDAFAVTRVPGKSADTISKELLIKYGVSAKIIAKCTIPGKSYEYPLIIDKVEAAATKAQTTANKRKGRNDDE